MNITLVLASLTSIAMILVGLFWLLRDFCTDSLREQLFAVRDELYTDAANGKISFDDQMYGIVRRTTNGFIRYAHELDLVTLFVILTFSRPPEAVSSSFREKMQTAKGALEPSQVLIYDRYMERVNLIVARHVVVSSPVFVITILLPILASVLIVIFNKRLVEALGGYFISADEAAFVAGKPMTTA